MSSITLAAQGAIVIRYAASSVQTLQTLEKNILEFARAVTRAGVDCFGVDCKVEVIAFQRGVIHISIKYPDLLASEVNLK